MVYTVEDASCKVQPNAVLGDANFLVALHSPTRKKLRDEAHFVLEYLTRQLIAPISVLVEAFHGCKDDARPLLSWVANYTNIDLLPEDTKLLSEARALHFKVPELDLVDCLLIVYAHKVGESVGSKRPIPILTADEPMMNIAGRMFPNLRFLDLRYPDQWLP